MLFANLVVIEYQKHLEYPGKVPRTVSSGTVLTQWMNDQDQIAMAETTELLPTAAQLPQEGSGQVGIHFMNHYSQDFACRQPDARDVSAPFVGLSVSRLPLSTEIRLTCHFLDSALCLTQDLFHGQSLQMVHRILSSKFMHSLT